MQGENQGVNKRNDKQLETYREEETKTKHETQLISD